MLDHYRDHFAALPEPAAMLVANSVARRYRLEVPLDPSRLYDQCSELGIDQADVVMSMANDPSALAVVALETVVGRPIQRGRPCLTGPEPKGRERAAPKEKHVRAATPRTNDPRVIATVVPNPKKPGSASHARYELYRVGMTVQEFLTAGGDKADIAWDTKKGFITFA